MSNVATKAKKPNLSVKSVLNWILDHAMIIVIVLLALYVQTQRDAFLKPASLINIISLTAARLPMALGVAGCIILAGTDLTGGRVAGLTAFVAAILLQRADVANRVLAGGAPANIVLVLLLVMLIGACVGLINGFVMAKFKVHPYIITLAMQMIVYGIYLTVSNSVQVGSFDSSYTTSFVTKPLFQIQTGVRPNGTAIFTVVPMYVLLALIVFGVFARGVFTSGRTTAERAQRELLNGGGKGDDFIGWVRLPAQYDREEYARILAAAKKIQGDSKALVVIGIGGSYLGARGVIECLCSPNYNLKKKDTPNVYFIGNGLSLSLIHI